MQDNQLTKEEVAQLTEADWKERLSADEYHVMREKGTERPHTGVYNDINDKGIYRCKGCGAKLFDSESKFDASCGWPSFDQGIDNDAIDEHEDNSLGMRRTEVTCSNCGAHLGHVFPDGPRETTGMRYCINSVSIDLDKEAQFRCAIKFQTAYDALDRKTENSHQNENDNNSRVTFEVTLLNICNIGQSYNIY